MKMFFLKSILSMILVLCAANTYASESGTSTQADLETRGAEPNSLGQEQQTGQDLTVIQNEEMMSQPSEYQENQNNLAETQSEEQAIPGETTSVLPEQEMDSQLSENADSGNATPASALNPMPGQDALVNISTKSETSEPKKPEDERPEDLGDRAGGSHKGAPKFLDIPIIRMGETSALGTGFKIIEGWKS